MMSVRLEPTASRSRVKHSTTEPLHSLCSYVNVYNLPYCDRYFNTYRQIEMFKEAKLMDMVLDKCIFQNRFPYFQ